MILGDEYLRCFHSRTLRSPQTPLALSHPASHSGPPRPKAISPRRAKLNRCAEREGFSESPVAANRISRVLRFVQARVAPVEVWTGGCGAHPSPSRSHADSEPMPSKVGRYRVERTIRCAISGLGRSSVRRPARQRLRLHARAGGSCASACSPQGTAAGRVMSPPRCL